MFATRRLALHAVRARAARTLLILAAAWALVQFAPQANAETWAERLGFGAEHRVIILHANELGMSYESNAAGIKLLDGGVVRSASAMAPCAWFADIAKWSQSHPDADIGLELTLNSEFETYRWQPSSPGRVLKSLRDADGFFWRTPIQTMVNADADEVEKELSAQIARARRLGLHPGHLTTHLGALVTRPDLIEAYLRMARKHWIPAMMVELTPEHVTRFESQGYPLPDDIIQLIADYPLPKVDDLKLVPEGESYEVKKQALLGLLGDLQPGITQVAFRPAIASDALSKITEDWQQRVWDAQLVMDEDLAKALKEHNIVVTDWRELMNRFEGGPDSTAANSETTAAAP